MKIYDATRLRNVALVGHSGGGKTQLLAALLHGAGAVTRLGHVRDGTTTTDVDEEAVARQHTLSASLAHVEWRDTRINVIDTPGMGTFFTDVHAALRVADAAVVVVDAVHGAEVQTEKAWAEAEALGLPRLVVVSRMDRERASLDRALASVRAACAREIVPLQVPIGGERAFGGCIDLVRMQALTVADDGSGRMVEGPIPPSLAAEAEAARERLVEAVAEADERLLESFLANGTLSTEQLVDGLRAAFQTGRLFPLLCASGEHAVGVPPLLDALVDYIPSPADRPFPVIQDGVPATARTDATGPATAFVWKTVADPCAGRMTMLRVVTGTFAPDTTVLNVSRGSHERLGHLALLQGKTQVPVPALSAGDIGAVARLRDTHTNDVLADGPTAIGVPAITVPEPVLSYAVEPRSRGDEDKISLAMQRLREEDPSLDYSRDAETHELRLSGQGQLHIEVTVARLRRRFGVEVMLRPPRVPYRETIGAATEAHGRHKKQTGGHGQFGDCKIRIEPLPRGSDFQFVDDIFGGAIPKQFVPAVEKGIEDARHRGYLAGYPVVDFRATVFDGSYHPVDSNELAFKMAGSLAFKDAMSRARPTLLEPVMRVEVRAPSDCAGDLLGDLNSRRGRIAGMDTRGAATIIRALVPMAEMLLYEQHLTSVTGGRGSYHMEHSHDDEVPAPSQARIIAAARAERSPHHGGDEAH